MSKLSDSALQCFDSEARGKPPSRKEIYKFICELAEHQSGEIRALQNRIDALEARDSAFKGVHQRAQAYSKGDFVTHSGNLWCALKEVPAGKTPGSIPEFWQLAAKGK